MHSTTHMGIVRNEAGPVDYSSQTKVTASLLAVLLLNIPLIFNTTIEERTREGLEQRKDGVMRGSRSLG